MHEMMKSKKRDAGLKRLDVLHISVHVGARATPQDIRGHEVGRGLLGTREPTHADVARATRTLSIEQRAEEVRKRTRGCFIAQPRISAPGQLFLGRPSS